MPRSFLDRYQSGECKAVWDDLVALGSGVRHELYLEDARAVAKETMRRAKRNVETLIAKLDQMGYEFLDSHSSAHKNLGRLEQLEGWMSGNSKLPRFGGNVAELAHYLGKDPGEMMAQAMRQAKERMAEIMPKLHELQDVARQRAAQVQKKPPLQDPAIFEAPPKDTAKLLAKLEKMARGPLPLSLRAWYEEAGSVSLMGSHADLNPEMHEPAADPLVVYPLAGAVNMLEDEEAEDGEVLICLSPDDLHKADISGGGPYCMRLPDSGADGKFLEERHGITFVEYLRLSFAWGGFPGWEGAQNIPTKELDYLREGLLPI
jgi:hypothetical protein